MHVIAVEMKSDEIKLIDQRSFSDEQIPSTSFATRFKPDVSPFLFETISSPFSAPLHPNLAGDVRLLVLTYLVSANSSRSARVWVDVCTCNIAQFSTRSGDFRSADTTIHLVHPLYIAPVNTAKMVLKVYGSAMATSRVLTTLIEKELPYEFIKVDISKGE